MSADKIGPQHRARKAVLYIRQSSAHQVQHNRESQGLQYAMRDRLAQLGWSQIEIIDEDLGCSAASGTARAGFSAMPSSRVFKWPSRRVIVASTRLQRADAPVALSIAS